MLKSFFWTSKNAFYAWAMLSLLLIISWYTVEILVYYNSWNREIYDAIQSLREDRFWTLFLGFDLSRLTDFIMLKEDIMPSFVEIIALYTPIAVYASWQTQRYCFKWRESNTHHYLNRWKDSPAKIEGGS